uniref:Uncharacterized protein n=1 Tax=Arundo donax TaxID=35708 RepID=A0A0A9DFW2_ARUDO
MVSSNDSRKKPFAQVLTVSFFLILSGLSISLTSVGYFFLHSSALIRCFRCD